MVCVHVLCDLCVLVCVCCVISAVCINWVLDQCRACSVQGRPVIINKVPVPAEMPPGPVSAPPPFPWGLSGHLPAGKALFCSITANAVVCHFPLHFLIIFSSGICYGIKTKRNEKTCSFCALILLGFLILAVWHPRGYCAFFLFHRALNKQDLLIFKSCTFGGAGRSQS